MRTSLLWELGPGKSAHGSRGHWEATRTKPGHQWQLEKGWSGGTGGEGLELQEEVKESEKARMTPRFLA